MNGLTLNPISDPNDLKEQAAAPAVQTPQNTTSPVSAQTQPAQPEAPAIAPPEAPVAETTPVNRAEQVTSVYPNPVRSPSSKPTIQSEQVNQKPYAYVVPAGIYVVSAGLIGYAITEFYTSAFLISLGSFESLASQIALAVYAVLIAFGLIKANKYAYWAAVLGLSALLLYSGYSTLTLFLSSQGGNVFSTVGWYYLPLLFAQPILAAATLIYLALPNVRGAF